MMNVPGQRFQTSEHCRQTDGHTDWCQ